MGRRTDEADDVAIRWKSTVLTGPDYLLDVSEMVAIDVDARGGPDQSMYTGSLWDDTITLYPQTGFYQGDRV